MSTRTRADHIDADPTEDMAHVVQHTAPQHVASVANGRKNSLLYLILGHAALVSVYATVLFFYLMANTAFLSFYESSFGYLWWPFLCAFSGLLALYVLCRGVGRRGVDPVRGWWRNTLLTFAALDLLGLYFMVIPFRTAWSFEGGGFQVFAWIAVLVTVYVLLWLALPVLALWPVVRFWVNLATLFLIMCAVDGNAPAVETYQPRKKVGGGLLARGRSPYKILNAMICCCRG